MHKVFLDDERYYRISEIKKLTITAVCIMLGIIIPYISGHAVLGNYHISAVFLPMHLPVLVCGIITDYKYGLLCGIITPLLSCLFTGMPALYPNLPIMLPELALYGFLGGFLCNKIKLNIYFALPITMLSGRLGYAAVFSLITAVSQTEISMLPPVAAFLAGLPGIIIQLVLIPIIVFSLRKGILSKYMVLNKSFKKAIELIETANASLVLVKNRQIIYQASGNGVSPLIKLAETAPDLLEGAYVIDKVIGKAAAMIIVRGKAKGIYGLLGSENAVDYLKSENIKFSFKKIVIAICNQDHTGVCPIEQAVLTETDLNIGYDKIKIKIKELRKENG